MDFVCAFPCMRWYEFCVRVPETIDGETIFICSQSKPRAGVVLAITLQYMCFC